jgi:hypothetical protein
VTPAAPPADPAWPGPLALLLGPDARDLLQVALGGFGGRLHELRVLTVGVQPSGAAVVQYAAEVERADGRRTREILAATTGSRIPSGAAVLVGNIAGERVEVGLWRWPQDPALPGLARLTDPGRLAATLAAAGLPRAGFSRVRVRAYRPGRRAVFELTGGGPRMFVKVVRPAAVEALRRRHDLLVPHLPTPPVLAATDDGVLVLPALAGTPLRTLLVRGAALPGGPALDALLDRLPAAVMELPFGRRYVPGDHLARVRYFADVLGLTAVTAPGSRARARLEELASALAAADPGEHAAVPVHGDFYEAQLLVEGGAVTGLLDVDTAGRGFRIDEWATLLAHLCVLGAPARCYGSALLAHAEHRWPRGQLRPRIAAAVLGLATGPFRVQQPHWEEHTERRLALAERWLESSGPRVRAPSLGSPGQLMPAAQPGCCQHRKPD